MKITIELDTLELRTEELKSALRTLLTGPQTPQSGHWIFEGPAPETTTIPRNTPITTTGPTGIGIGSATISSEAPPPAPTQPVEVSPQQTFTAEANTHTLEEVRATLAALNKAGKRAQVKALLQEFGTEKLTEVDPGYYPALMQKAEAL